MDHLTPALVEKVDKKIIGDAASLKQFEMSTTGVMEEGGRATSNHLLSDKIQEFVNFCWMMVPKSETFLVCWMMVCMMDGFEHVRDASCEKRK